MEAMRLAQQGAQSEAEKAKAAAAAAAMKKQMLEGYRVKKKARKILLHFRCTCLLSWWEWFCLHPRCVRYEVTCFVTWVTWAFV